MNNQKESVYSVLSKVNVEKFVKGKNGYRYLSWSDAVASLLEHYPTANWSHREWDGVPYCKIDGGCFVEVTVVVENIKRSELHPILNYANKPITNPNSFDINNSLKRALAKAISLHGLGLYIYQGEDLPISEKEANERDKHDLIERAKNELIQLLKHHKLHKGLETDNFINKMPYEQLVAKIESYRK